MNDDFHANHIVSRVFLLNDEKIMTGANVPFAQRLKQSTGCLFFSAMVGIASVSCAVAATECRHTPAGTGSQRSLPIDVPFTVASWNIRKGIDAQWIETVRDLSNPADLVLLQEGYIPNELERLGFVGSEQWFAPGYLTTNKQTGVLTAAAVDVLMHCQVTAMEPWLGTPKAMAVTDFAARGSAEVLRVINVHGVNFELGEENLTAQLQMLQPYLEDHKGPLILAGDFNTWSDGRTKALMTLAGRFNLHAVEFAPDARTTALSYPLDHILLRDLAVLESGVTVTDRSDHNLLWVTVVQPRLP